MLFGITKDLFLFFNNRSTSNEHDAKFHQDISETESRLTYSISLTNIVHVMHNTKSEHARMPSSDSESADLI